MYNKQLMDLFFVICKIINTEVRLTLPLARLITLTSTMIVLQITGNESNNCLLFAEQLKAVHNTFYTFMLFQHVKKQPGFMRMQYQQYFLVIKTKAPLLDWNTSARWTGKQLIAASNQFYNFYALHLYHKNVLYIRLSAEAPAKKRHNR